MIRRLTVGTVGMALLALAGAWSPRVASAQASPPPGNQDDITVGPAVQAQAKRNMDVAETAYATAGAQGAVQGGMSGVVAAAGGADAVDLNKVLAARNAARQTLENTIGAEEKVIQTRANHLQASGDTTDAAALLATLAPLQDRLAQLTQDAANDEAVKSGAPLLPVSIPRSKMNGAGGGSFTAGGTPPNANVDTAGGAGTGTGGIDGGAGGSSGNGAPGGALPAPVARKVTGKLILVAKGEKPETSLAHLDKECERIRKGEAPSDDELDLPATGVEVWIVEKWQEKHPVRVRLAATTENVRALAMLKLKPGITVAFEGMAQPDPMGKGSLNGEVFVLTAWKQLAAPADPKKPAPAPKAAAGVGGDE